MTKNSLTKVGKYIVGEGSYYIDVFAEKKRTNKAKEVLAVGAAEHIVDQFGTEDPIAKRALQREFNRMYRSQDNIEGVTRIALEDLENSDKSKFQDLEIDEDWLHMFFNIAGQFSSEQMQEFLGKLLSGEIQSPSTFSPKTLQLIPSLDRRALSALQDFLSCAFISTFMVQPKVPNLGFNIGENGLKKFELSYSKLLILQDYGLAGSDFLSYQEISENVLTIVPHQIGDKFFVTECIDPPDPKRMIKFSGLSLSIAGTEISKVMNFGNNEDYWKAFSDWLKEKHKLRTIEIPADSDAE